MQHDHEGHEDHVGGVCGDGLGAGGVFLRQDEQPVTMRPEQLGGWGPEGRGGRGSATAPLSWLVCQLALEALVGPAPAGLSAVEEVVVLGRRVCALAPTPGGAVPALFTTPFARALVRYRRESGDPGFLAGVEGQSAEGQSAEEPGAEGPGGGRRGGAPAEVVAGQWAQFGQLVAADALDGALAAPVWLLLWPAGGRLRQLAGVLLVVDAVCALPETGVRVSGVARSLERAALVLAVDPPAGWPGDRRAGELVGVAELLLATIEASLAAARLEADLDWVRGEVLGGDPVRG